MFIIVILNLISDKDASQKICTLTIANDCHITKTIQAYYDDFVLTYEGDITDLSLASEVTEGVKSLILAA